jgi:hypothetical protein
VPLGISTLVECRMGPPRRSSRPPEGAPYHSPEPAYDQLAANLPSTADSLPAGRHGLIEPDDHHLSTASIRDSDGASGVERAVPYLFRHDTAGTIDSGEVGAFNIAKVAPLRVIKVTGSVVQVKEITGHLQNIGYLYPVLSNLG